jgi:transcriptional regulator GlxA family with amidase domain
MHLPAQSRITTASAAEPYVGLALALDLSVVRALGEEIPPTAEAGEIRAAATMAADSDILDAMGRLFALVERPAAAAVLAPLIAREIHYWLLQSRHGGPLRSLAQTDSRAARITRAISVIRRDFERPIAIADLAQTAAMSLSAFHHHFRAITGLTPLQFQKQLRLSEARRLMLAEDRSIAAAAFAVGYESTTQFTREYARQFGAPPRRDLRAANERAWGLAGDARAIPSREIGG